MLSHVSQLVGVAIFAGGIYLAVTSDLYSVVAGSSYAAGAAIIIVCGIGTIAVSIVGLIGAIGQFRLLLLIVSLPLLILQILVCICYSCCVCNASFQVLLLW